jgi:hypothetical protein
MSNRWSETNLPGAQDVEAAEATLARLTQDGNLRNTDLIEWVNARITADWAAAPAQAEEGRAR